MYYGSIHQSLLCIFQQEFHLANLHYLRELTAQYHNIIFVNYYEKSW